MISLPTFNLYLSETCSITVILLSCLENITALVTKAVLTFKHVQVDSLSVCEKGWVPSYFQQFIFFHCMRSHLSEPNFKVAAQPFSDAMFITCIFMQDFDSKQSLFAESHHCALLWPCKHYIAFGVSRSLEK